MSRFKLPMSLQSLKEQLKNKKNIIFSPLGWRGKIRYSWKTYSKFCVTASWGFNAREIKTRPLTCTLKMLLKSLTTTWRSSMPRRWLLRTAWAATGVNLGTGGGTNSSGAWLRRTHRAFTRVMHACISRSCANSATRNQHQRLRHLAFGTHNILRKGVCPARQTGRICNKCLNGRDQVATCLPAGSLLAHEGRATSPRSPLHKNKAISYHYIRKKTAEVFPVQFLQNLIKQILFKVI